MELSHISIDIFSCYFYAFLKKEELFYHGLHRPCFLGYTTSLISLYSSFQLTESDIEALAGFCPSPTQILSISQKNIRLALPHWTPSRYHTAPISQVVESIYDLLLCGKPFLKVYNSNLNLKNRKVYNDRYILLISNCKSVIIDVNRRNINQFYSES